MAVTASDRTAGIEASDLEEGKPISESELLKPGSEQASTSDAVAASAGVRVTFRGVSCQVRTRRGWKPILQQLDGYFLSGAMAAVMGPSGAGKSTLLDILAGRKTVGRLDGRVLFGGRPPSHALMQELVGYVEQYDTLLEALTVREMLMYTAELRAATSRMPRAVKQALVAELLGKLMLEECASVRIGSRLRRGVSGGQAKRTNIAVALIGSPAVLFLDEPTSGLDSYSAFEVMALVHKLAQQGTTICATVHQPSSKVLELFSQVLLMVHGRLVYGGPTGQAIVDFFTHECPASLTLPLHPGDNIAEWMTHIAGAADRAAPSQLLNRPQGPKPCSNGRADEPTLAQSYQASSRCAAEQKALTELEAEDSQKLKEGAQPWSQQRRHRVGFLRQVWVLWRYRTLARWSSPAWLMSRTFDKAAGAFVLATVYWQKGNNLTPETAVNVAAIVFLFTLMPSFAAQVYIPSIMEEKAAFYREQDEGLYHISAYLVHKVVEELGMLAVLCPVLSVAVYYTTALTGSLGFVILILFLTVSISTMFGYFLASVVPTWEVASSMLAAYIGSLMYFTGFFVAWSQIPPWWKWYAILNYLRYASGALLLNEFQGDKASPEQSALAQEQLALYSLQGASRWAYAGYCTIFFGVFTVLTWAGLRFVRHSQR